MDVNIFYKVILFWFIFFISPGPVWVAVMEATRKLNLADNWHFFVNIFLPVNLSIQFVQAIICVVFVEFVSQFFSQIGIFLYILGGLYISYLSYKTLKSKKSNILLELSFVNLATIILLSPKIWLLFPSGAVIANKLSENTALNVAVFSFSMLVISNLMFAFYVIIGKVGTRLLKDNFSYLAAGLLAVFSLFLFNEAFYLVF